MLICDIQEKVARSSEKCVPATLGSGIPSVTKSARKIRCEAAVLPDQRTVAFSPEYLTATSNSTSGILGA